MMVQCGGRGSGSTDWLLISHLDIIGVTLCEGTMITKTTLLKDIVMAASRVKHDPEYLLLYGLANTVVMVQKYTVT
jgi:hypothetical protein